MPLRTAAGQKITPDLPAMARQRRSRRPAARTGRKITPDLSAEEVAEGAGTSLPIPTIKQEQTNWCWAASIQMILRFYGNSTVRQCDLASTLFGAACCSAPPSSVCNQGATPAQQLIILNAYGRTGTNVNGQVSFSTIQFEINSRRPLTAGIHWNGGGGHRVVVRGWYDPQKVDIADPWYAGGVVNYSDLQTGYGMGTWYGTMTNIH